VRNGQGIIGNGRSYWNPGAKVVENSLLANVETGSTTTLEDYISGGLKIKKLGPNNKAPDKGKQKTQNTTQKRTNQEKKQKKKKKKRSLWKFSSVRILSLGK